MPRGKAAKKRCEARRIWSKTSEGRAWRWTEYYTNNKRNCGICGEHMEFDDATRDHIIPLAKGGADAAHNMQLAHWRCNNEKGDTV